MGERAPKGAEDDSATQEQQDVTQQDGNHDESVDDTGDTLVLAANYILCIQRTALKVNKEVDCAVQHSVKCEDLVCT